MRIAMACSGRLGASLMEPLLRSPHQVVAMLQNGRQYHGLQRKLMPMLAGTLSSKTTPTGMARSNGIPIIWIDKMTEVELAPLRALEPDVLLVGGFSIILKKPLLTLPKIGCVNTHSSLLPRRRGPNPFHWIIRDNDTETGVTFHVIAEGIDTGDIIRQYPYPVSPTDTLMGIYKTSCEIAGEHVLEVMDLVEKEGLHGTPQDESAASYEKKPTGEDVTIRWDDSAVNIERLMRASVPVIWPRFYYRGRPIYLSKVKAENVATDAEPGTILEVRPRVRIATGDGVLRVLYAYQGWPLPFLWPMPWNRPAKGEKVS
ncbi:MAG: methionyl-tRNA formyltransferase [Candidatus Hydrogenedentes bacterium]|nr:methionyl-tRNA formyltransferase [Candidatus Hydrogenedentota bacterium]